MKINENQAIHAHAHDESQRWGSIARHPQHPQRKHEKPEKTLNPKSQTPNRRR